MYVLTRQPKRPRHRSQKRPRHRPQWEIDELEDAGLDGVLISDTSLPSESITIQRRMDEPESVIPDITPAQNRVQQGLGFSICQLSSAWTYTSATATCLRTMNQRPIPLWLSPSSASASTSLPRPTWPPSSRRCEYATNSASSSSAYGTAHPFSSYPAHGCMALNTSAALLNAHYSSVR